MNLNKKLNSFIKLDFNIKILVFKIYFQLLKTKLLLVFLPIQLTIKKRKILIEENNQIQLIKNYTLALKAAQNFVFWKNKCLINSITLHNLLLNKQIITKIHLGIDKSANDYSAHAWLSLNNENVLSQNSHKEIYIFK